LGRSVSLLVNKFNRDMSTTYRADIDGLRAVSVLAVLLYHLGITAVPGGFVGVDVFFVISGFLITQILRREVVAGTFTVAGFYERRIRRIFPAMLAVLLATLVTGYFIVWPGDFLTLGRSSLYAVFGAANLYFYWHTGYFDPSAHLQPLLHFWSLAVEEQFYLVWPALVYLAARPRVTSSCRLLATVAAVILVSLLAAAIQVYRDPTAAFYLSHLRAWELAIGAAVAVLPSLPAARALRESAAALGLGLVAYGIFGLTEHVPFPGLNALPPTLGAALLIWSGAGDATLIGRALSWRPAVRLGLISYSLYLWHWPIIVFYKRLTSDAAPAPMAALGLAALSIVLATLSWRFVERPFRSRSGLVRTRRGVFGSAVVATACVVAAAGVVVQYNGFSSRLDGQLAKVLAYNTYYPTKEFRIGKCFLEPTNTVADFDVAECMAPAGPKAVLIWGDSTVAQYYWGLREPMRQAGHALWQMTASSCPPMLGKEIPERPQCKAINDFVMQQVERTKPYAVVLGAAWYLDLPSLAQLQETIRRIRATGARVIVMGDVPRFHDRVPNIEAKRIREGSHDTTMDIRWNSLLTQARGILQNWIQQQPGVTYVPTIDVLCPAEKCRIVTDDGLPMYYDVIHLTDVGTEAVGPRLAPAILAGIDGGPRAGLAP
jgi:peptidoglycan/LPS O-acetylase OafA/YrhL